MSHQAESQKLQLSLMMNMGEVLLAQGKPEHSLKYCEDALALCHSNDKNLAHHKATVLLTKARCLERQGQLEQAMDCFEEALGKASSSATYPVPNQMVVGGTTGNVVKGIIGGQTQVVHSTKQVLIHEIQSGIMQLQKKIRASNGNTDIPNISISNNDVSQYLD